MKTEPINHKIHEILISKGYFWKPKVHVDMYHKNGTLIFVYMNDYVLMTINGKVATKKELEDAAYISS